MTSLIDLQRTIFYLNCGGFFYWLTQDNALLSCIPAVFSLLDFTSASKDSSIISSKENVGSPLLLPSRLSVAINLCQYCEYVLIHSKDDSSCLSSMITVLTVRYCLAMNSALSVFFFSFWQPFFSDKSIWRCLDFPTSLLCLFRLLTLNNSYVLTLWLQK